MKLVIDIPEGFYEEVRKDPSILAPPFLSCEKVGEIIANGTPLPKGHGDLKDADRLLDGFSYEYCRYGDFGYRQAEDLIKSSLTIIEADKEEE